VSSWYLRKRLRPHSRLLLLRQQQHQAGLLIQAQPGLRIQARQLHQAGLWIQVRQLRARQQQARAHRPHLPAQVTTPHILLPLIQYSTHRQRLLAPRLFLLINRNITSSLSAKLAALLQILVNLSRYTTTLPEVFGTATGILMLSRRLVNICPRTIPQALKVPTTAVYRDLFSCIYDPGVLFLLFTSFRRWHALD